MQTDTDRTLLSVSGGQVLGRAWRRDAARTGRRGVSAVAVLSVVAATLTFAAATGVVKAPPATAAPGTCPPGYTYVSSSSRCLIILDTNSASPFSLPTHWGGRSFEVLLIGGGGGGGAGNCGTNNPGRGAGGNPGERWPPSGQGTHILPAGTGFSFTIGSFGLGGTQKTFNCEQDANLDPGGLGNPTSITESGGTTRTALGGTGGASAAGTSYNSTGWQGANGPMYGISTDYTQGGGGNGGASGGGSGATSGSNGQSGAVFVWLRPGELPAPMSGQTPGVTVNNSQQATVTFSTVSSYPDVTSYLATCTSGDGGTPRSSSSSSSPITVSSLTRGTNYTCTVTPTNVVGSGTSTNPSASFFVPGAPWPITAPTVSGVAKVGGILTGTPGTWGTPPANAIDDTSYRWEVTDDSANGPWVSLRDDTTSLTYSIADDSLAGKFIRLAVQAKNSLGWSVPPSYSASTLQITRQPVFVAQTPPTVADDSVAYQGYTFNASGFRITYSVDDSSGQLTGLPPGMTLNSSTGALSGTPRGVGTWTYRVKATNDSGFVFTPTLTLTISDGAPAQLVIAQQPIASMPSRTQLPTQPIIKVLDDSGYVIYTPKNIRVSANGLRAVLGGTLDDSTGSAPGNQPGFADFTNLTLGGVVDDTYTLTFTVTGPGAGSSPSVTSQNLFVLPGAATNVRLRTLPIAAAVAGAVMTTQPIALIRDADGNTTLDDSVVTLRPDPGGFVGPPLLNYATATAVNGVAAFSGVPFGGLLNVPTRLVFSSPGLTDDTASVVSTQTGSAYKLAVTTEANSPSNSGAAFTTVPVVTRQDMGSNVVSGDPQATVSASISPTSQPYQVLVGPTSRPTVNGVATFTGLGLSGKDDSIYTITYSSGGLYSADDTVEAATGAPARLSLTATGAVAPGDASYDDTKLLPQPVVRVVDSGNNVVSVPNVLVTASVVSGTGTLTNPTATSNASGIAAFSNLRLSGLAGTYVLRFSDDTYGYVDDTVVMRRAAQTVTLSPIPNKNLDDTPFTIAASARPSRLTVSFSTTTPSVCAVGGPTLPATDDTTYGAVSVVGAGTCRIIASQGGNANYEPATDDSTTFNVSKAAQRPLTLIGPSTATAGQTVTLRTVGGSGTGNVSFFESRDDSSICSVVSSTGVVTFSGTGNFCDFRATKLGDVNYLDDTSAPLRITVAAAASGGLTPQTVAFTSVAPASPVDDDTYVPTATATSGLVPTVSIASSTPASGVCSSSGSPVMITFDGPGTCVLQATQGGDSRFAAASPIATQTILVYLNSGTAASGLRNQSISWPQPADKRIGDPNFALAATASSGLPVQYSSTTGSVCTTTVGGIVQLVSTGTCTIVANSPNDGTYAAADPVTRSFEVTAGLPSAPRILSTAAGSGAATIAFASPDDTGGSAIIAYTILATPVGSGTSVSTSACTSSPCTIRGLADGTTYTLKIAAINGIGTGPYSVSSASVAPKGCSLCAAGPGGPGAPGGPTGDRLDDTTVVLNWSQPSSLGGGTFVSYNVYFRVIGTTWPPSPYVSITNIATTTATITGLTPGVAYEFLVLVVTTTSPSPEPTPPSPNAPNAAIVTVGTPTAPSAPQSVSGLYVTDTSIVASWAYPASDGGSPITSFTVSFSPAATCSSVVMDDTTRTANCNAVGLAAATTYTIRVTATNAIGTGPAASATYRTPGVEPAPPAPPIPPGPPTPSPEPPGPQPLPGPTPPRPGQVEVVVDGQPLPGVTTTPGDGTITVGGNDESGGGGDFSLTVSAYLKGERIPLGPGDVLTVPERGQVQVTGTGYAPRSRVSVYIGGAPLLLLGITTTTANGTFSTRMALPGSVTAGDYVLQVNGYNEGANIRSINIGMTVVKAPWIKIKGKRQAAHIKVSGLSGELARGTVVIPMIKTKKTQEFTKGTGVRKVHADGSFTWQRKVAKGKSIWVYFTVMPVKSNTVALMAKTTRT